MESITASRLRKELFSIMKHIHEKPVFFTYKGERFSILPERERIRIGLIDTNLKKLSRKEIQTAIDGKKSIEYVIDTSFLTEAFKPTSLDSM